MAIIDKPTDHFNTVIWTGANTTGSRTVTGVGFQPDFVWVKSRDTTVGNIIYDSVRGAGANSELFTIGNYVEGAGNQDYYDYLSSFNSDGFASIYVANESAYFNFLNRLYVSWNLKAGGTAVSNTAGSITSSVSANTTSGFSVVTYTGNGTGGANFGHGLGVKPACVIVKRRNSATNWQFVSKALSATPFASGNYLKLNSSDPMGTNTAVWNAEPTSSLIYLTTSGDTNASGGTYVAYCFANTSMIKCGKYTGNGSTNGTFVYTGMKPAFVLIKRTDVANNWLMFDNKRNPYNFLGKYSIADLSMPESAGATDYLDFLSNGFKLNRSGADVNASGGSYIYLAIAEQPFVTSTTNGSIPATAR